MDSLQEYGSICLTFSSDMAEPEVIILHRHEHYHCNHSIALSLWKIKIMKTYSYYHITWATILLFLCLFYLLQIKTFRTTLRHYFIMLAKKFRCDISMRMFCFYKAIIWKMDSCYSLSSENKITHLTGDLVWKCI